ncbi:hypothetical protein ES703_88052 [subsurface metagenome]
MVKTKQDLFMHKLKLNGGEATTKEMMGMRDEDRFNVHSLSKHLERRNKIEIIKNRGQGKSNKFKIKKKRYGGLNE